MRQPGIRRRHVGGRGEVERVTLRVLILLALALRAVIPIGFMPAGDGTLSLMICPSGFPLALLPPQKMMDDGMEMPAPRPHQHGGQGVTDAYCVFTTGFSSAPPLQLVVTFGLLVAAVAVMLARVPAPTGIRFVYIPEARAPPPAA